MAKKRCFVISPIGPAGSEIREHAESRSSQAAGGLRTFSAQLDALAQGRVDEAGPLVGYVQEVGQRATGLAA